MEGELTTELQPVIGVTQQPPRCSIWRSNGKINVSVAIEGDVTEEEGDAVVDRALAMFHRARRGAEGS